MKLNKNKLGGALLCLAAVIGLLVLMDLCLGGANAWLYHRSKYGIFHRQQYVLNESKDDIIILGSSRAAHQYIPSILSDSLGMTCYNAGSEGMCVFYHYSILAAMIERGHKPKLVIYDVMDLDTKDYPGPTFTLDAALDRLAPHYGDFASIDNLFALKGWKERLKLCSLSYRYNSKLVQSIKCNYIPQPENNGYEKVMGVLSNKVLFEYVNYDDCSLDSLKILYMQKMIRLANQNDIRMIFVLSPYYKNKPSKALDVSMNIAKQNQIDIIDCYNEQKLMKRELFRDEMHLNDEGAHVWTAHLAHIIKRLLEQ